ncbi:MAG: hypothetical protein AB8F94_23585 [Saprospiraceae bacterium]
MKNSVMKKLEEQATIYMTLSMMISLSAKDVSEYLALPLLQYIMIAIAIVFIVLGVIKVKEYEKQKVNKSCNS